MGHAQVIERLERARRLGRVAHAYLFHGPDGVGKLRVALAFAQALTCLDADAAPCGVCESCSKIERFTHPDVRLVACEASLVERGLIEAPKTAPSLQIKNAQLDDLAGLFRHRPYLGRCKVVVVEDADRMNQNSQNRFLKTLEEPSDDSVILLVSGRPQALLPTIRSRCQALAFGPLPRAQVAAHLAQSGGLEPERARVLAAMAQGSLGRAKQLADEGFMQVRDETLGDFERVMQGDLADVMSAADDIGDGRAGRDRLADALDLLEMWIRDLLFQRLGVDDSLLVNQDRQTDLRRLAEGQSPRTLLRWMERIREVRGALAVNINPRMAAEAMLLAMRNALQ